jgi:hypothetical protein
LKAEDIRALIDRIGASNDTPSPHPVRRERHPHHSRAPNLAHLAAKEAQAQTKGLKLSGYAVPRGLPKANFYVTHPADEPAHADAQRAASHPQGMQGAQR